MAVIHGDNNPNFLLGTNSVDIIYGYDGNDYLYGYGQRDYLYGMDGNDVLIGMDGNDYLHGGLGSDRMYGGVGNDRYIVDRLSDRVIEYAGEGIDTVEAYVSDYILPNHVENLYLRSTVVAGSGNILDNQIYGNNVDNIIHGNGGNDSIYGEDGNDYLTGDGGADEIEGGKGSDYISGGTGDDLLKGESGNDALYGNTGDDELIGGTGNDIIAGGGYTYNSNEKDTLTSGELNDTDRFLLGNSFGSYYLDNGVWFGNKAYATITDFDEYNFIGDISDKLVLYGSANNYHVSTSGGTSQIYYKPTATSFDLIAVVDTVSNTGVNLSEDAIFV